MKRISINNDQLLSMLNDIAKSTIEDEGLISKANDTQLKDQLISDLHPTSEQYLFKALESNKHEFGFPRAAHGIGMKEYFTELSVKNDDSEQVFDVQRKIDRLTTFLAARNNALAMIYPPKGYIGWHHNGNAPGYNILLTYSIDGDGDFSYWDYDKKEIVVMPDIPGWSAKVGFYPHAGKTDKVFWHKANTNKQRITIAFVVPDKIMWLDMIDEITDGKFNEKEFDNFI